MNDFRYLDVLVLDEDPLFCVLTQETLRLLGFRDVYTACQAAAAAWILERNRPAMLIVSTDQEPTEIWSALSEGRHRSTLIVATSFARGARARIDAIRRGADAFLPKPYSKEQLLRTLLHVLNGEAGRRCKIIPFKAPERRSPARSAQGFARTMSVDPGESTR